MVVFVDNLKCHILNLAQIGLLERSVSNIFAKICVGLAAHAECKFTTIHNHIVGYVGACVGLAVPQYLVYMAVLLRQSLGHHAEDGVLTNDHLCGCKARYA